MELTYNDGETLQAVFTEGLLHFDPKRIMVNAMGSMDNGMPRIGIPRCLLSGMRVVGLIDKKRYLQGART